MIRNREADRLPLKFHTVHGYNITLNRNRCRVVNNSSSFEGLVFSNRPILIDELVCIRKHISTDNIYLGVTTIDPFSITPHLAVLSYFDTVFGHLGKPNTYWIRKPELPGSELSGRQIQFSLSQSGSIECRVVTNGVATELDTFRYRINTNVPLWVIFNVNCHQKIEFETPPSLVHGPIQMVNSSSMNRGSTSLVDGMASMSLSNGVQTNQQFGPSDCSICLVTVADTAVIACGHMCMCNGCAVIIKRSGDGCPICRKPIKDILKIFFS